MDLRTKRIYDDTSDDDGCRILIDRLWPRGLSKEKARVDHWLKDVAPSTELRQWYGHDPAKWEEFRARYFAELADEPEGLSVLRKEIQQGRVTLLFSSRETKLNNAAALVEFLNA